MREEYDFSNARKNPHAEKLKKQITMPNHSKLLPARLDAEEKTAQNKLEVDD